MRQDTLDLLIPIILIPLLLFALWRIRIKKLNTYISPGLGKIEIYEKYNKEKALTINQYTQGVSTDDNSIKKSYWFFIAGQVVKFCTGRRDPQVLMLGLGANTISNLIAKLDPNIHQTLIEIDKYVIQACREYFGLDDLPNYRIIQVDAYKYLTTSYPLQLTTYDVIIVDIFTGKPPYVDLKSNKPSFIQTILPWLKKDGMVIFNRPGHNRKAYQDSLKLKEHLETKFKNVEVFDISDPRKFINNVITAKDLKS